jgi:hypothetical protein
MTIKQNIDLEKLEGFRTFMKDNPDKAQLSLEVKAIYEGQVGRSLVHIGKFGLDGDVIDRPTRQYTFPFGAWKEVEGGQDGARRDGARGDSGMPDQFGHIQYRAHGHQRR